MHRFHQYYKNNGREQYGCVRNYELKQLRTLQQYSVTLVYANSFVILFPFPCIIC